jgi:hypothetical protein
LNGYGHSGGVLPLALQKYQIRPVPNEKNWAAIAEWRCRKKKKAGRRTRPTLKISMKKLYLNKAKNLILFCCNK